MKKLFQFIGITFTAILSAFVLTASTSYAESLDVAQIDNTTYSSLEAAITAAGPNSTITLLADLNTTAPIVLNKSLTINGTNHKITSALSGSDAAFLIETSDPVTITNLNVTSSARGININPDVHHLTLRNATLTVADRGLSALADNNHSSTILIEDSLIQNSKVQDYDREVPGGDLRGLSLWQYSDSEITLKNTTVQGFTYVININPDNFESSNTSLLIDGCALKGRAGLNVWTTGLDITLKNSEIVGINNFSGSSENFANIVINSPAAVNLDIIGTKFTNFQNETGLLNPNALQHAIALRGNGSTISISGNTTFTDTTGKLESFFAPSNTDNTISITGGTYDFDVSAYIPTGYQVLTENGRYTVIPIPATSNDAEIILPTPSDEDYSLTLDDSAASILTDSLVASGLLSSLTSTDNVSVIPELTALDAGKVPASVQAQIATALKTGQHLAQYFDLSIIVRANSHEIGTLSELSAPVEFSFQLPETLQKPGRKFFIIRLHDGQVDQLDARLDGNRLVFESDKFSTYALAYTDETAPTIPTASETPSDSPSADPSDAPETPGTGLLARLRSGDASAVATVAFLLVLSLSTGYAAYLTYLRHAKKTNTHE